MSSSKTWIFILDVVSIPLWHYSSEIIYICKKWQLHDGIAYNYSTPEGPCRIPNGKIMSHDSVSILRFHKLRKRGLALKSYNKFSASQQTELHIIKNKNVLFLFLTFIWLTYIKWYILYFKNTKSYLKFLLDKTINTQGAVW